MQAKHGGGSPPVSQGASRERWDGDRNNRKDSNVVLPSEVAEYVQQASMADLLDALDPVSGILDLIAGGSPHEWWRCPACGTRRVTVEDCVNARCACGVRFTRWQLGGLVLNCSKGVARVAQQVANRRRRLV